VPVTEKGIVAGKEVGEESWAVTVMVPDSPALLRETEVNETVGTGSSSVRVAV
jgi:hypothetical protein